MQVASYVDADVYDVDHHGDLIDRMMSSDDKMDHEFSTGIR